jgi:amino acid transporter
MGVLMSLYGLSGYETGAALSEETKNANIEAPKGMVEAVVASCVTGFIFIVGLLYACQNSISSVLEGVTEQGVVNIIFNSVSGNLNWTLFLTFVLFLNIFLAGFSHMTVTIRITYALVRDHALPGSKWMSYINPESHNPDRVALVILILDASLCLLPLLSTTAFVAITQITTIGFQISYGLPIFLRLY